MLNKHVFKATKSPLLGLAYDDVINSPTHQHRAAQLIHCSRGCFELSIEDRLFLVSPAHAIWIPSNTPHQALSTHKVAYRSLYIEPNAYDDLPQHIQTITVSPLLNCLIESACQFKDGYPTKGPEARIASVIIDQLCQAETQSYTLPLSDHPSIQFIYNRLIKNLSKNISPQQLAIDCCISAKTMGRLFQKEVGMSFEQWRLQLKTIKAIELLSLGESTTTVAGRLGYSNDSAFIEMFKRRTGYTPTHFKPEK